MTAEELASLRAAAIAVDVAADALADASAMYEARCLALVRRMKADGESIPGIPALTSPRSIIKARIGNDDLLARALDLSFTRPTIQIAALIPAAPPLAPTAPARQVKPPIRQRATVFARPSKPKQSVAPSAATLREHDEGRVQPRREGFVVDEAAKARFDALGTYKTTHRASPPKKEN